jgi:hypothetical protein
MTKPLLESCPWCRSIKNKNLDVWSKGPMNSKYVKCLICGAQGPWKDEKGRINRTKKDAIEAWNSWWKFWY